MTRLADNVLLFTGAGCNVLGVVGTDDVTLVDGGLAANTEALVQAVDLHTGGRPIRTLINTHWHSDHTGSNEVVGRRGAAIVAHDNTRRWLGSLVYREAPDRVYTPRPPEAIPTKTLTRSMSIAVGTTRLEIGALPPAHTNGDLYVFVRDANVLMVSDALTVRRYPVMDYSTGGWIGGLIDANTELLAIANDATRIVPGLGAIQTKADLQNQKAMLTTVKDRVWALIRQGKGLAEIKATAPTREFDASWGANDAFLQATYIGLVRHTHELGGVL